jgi:hypothetical protein
MIFREHHRVHSIITFLDGRGHMYMSLPDYCGQLPQALVEPVFFGQIS